MQGKSDLIHIKRKSLLYFVITVLALGIVTPVLADYLGPDRATTTSEVDTYDYGVWARDNNKAPYCLDKNGNKADDCIVCEWKRKPGNACGDATYSYKLGTISEVVETTIDLPPATISSSLQNCNSNNGWCNTLPTLSLNGSEPLSGYSILAVEGSLNGQTFACSGSACDVPLNEGNNDFTFWALSSYGDSSEMGTLSAKVDTVSPNVGLNVIGSNGMNNWYVSPTTISATGSDSTSGLSNVLLSVSGGAWTASTTLNDGVYTVDVQAEDNAGNVSTSSTAIAVDTVTPSISLNVNGAMGGNGWYSSTMQVAASASDLTSGIASLEVSTDGGVYQAYTSPASFADGYHTIRFKATDNAGNQTETPVQEFYVDATAPAIDLPASWEVDKTIAYNVQDAGSGLATLRIVIEDEDEKYKKVAWDEEVSGDKFKGEITWNGKFKDGTIAPPGEYLVWIKAKDKAGNERFGLGRVIVPQPTVFSLLQPTTTNNQETLLPPQELFDEDELPIANPSATTTPQQNLRFGESITDPKESTQTSLSLATGAASASTATNSNILWGATAAALIGWATATALEEKKKRKALHRASRDEAEQIKARASRDEEPSLTRQEKELAKQRKELQKIWDANGAAIYEANREYTAKHGKEMDAAARSKAIKEATMNGVFNAGTYASNLEAEQMRRDAQNEHMANKMTRFEKEEEARWQASQKSAEEKKAQDLQDGLAAYYSAMRQGEREARTNWWEQTKSFVQEKIIEPYTQPIVNVLDEKVYQPYIKPAVAQVKATQTYQTLQSSLVPKKIITVALTLAIGANTVQWVNNLKSNPDVFLPARTQAQSLIEELRINHPPAPEKHSLSYIVSHPYDVLATGSDYLNALTSIGASYADAIWQQNPLTQLAVESLETLEDSLCSRVTSQAWANRCTAAFYLGAGLTATPFDTTMGVGNSFLVDPVVGFLKQGALSIETYTALPDLVTAIREEGWEGAKDFVSELWTNRLEIILNDKQMQSAFFVEGLILLALIAAPVAGGVILGMTANSLMELDAAVTASKNKKSLIEFVTSHEVRTTVVSSALILTMIAAGVGNKALEFRAFQERLSPSAQTNFQTLSLLEQTRLADLAVKLKLSPSTVEFYINESSRFGSPLANMPLADALHVSSLADQSGKGAFVLDYLARYGMDNALRNASPEGLQFYVEQAKAPSSTLSELTTQQGVTLSQLSPASIAKVTGMTKPIIPEGVVPDISTPVLNLTPQEISVLTKLSSENPNAKYAVLGLWKNGQGYTVLGSEGYTYLNMPNAIYDTFFKNYPGDFRLINELFLKSLATEGKPIILETPYAEILKMEDLPSERRPTLYWEIIEVLESQYKYFLQDESGPGGYDLLVTEK